MNLKSEVQTVCRVLVSADYELRERGLKHVWVVLLDRVRADNTSVSTWLELDKRGECLEKALLSLHVSQRWGASSDQEILRDGPMVTRTRRIEILVRDRAIKVAHAVDTVRAHLPGCDVSVGRE